MNVETIAKMAYSFVQKKPNKADAFKALLGVIEELEDSHPELCIQISRVYKYFEPDTKGKPKNSAEWAAKAMGKGDTRPYLNWLYIDGGNKVASDGNRMHLTANDDGKPTGYYDKMGIKHHHLEDYWKFPDYNRLLYNTEDWTIVTVDEFTPSIFKDNQVMQCKNITLDAKYFLDMVSNPNGVPVIKVGTDMAMFEWLNGDTGLLMGMKV
jgi:hypothetical protein